MQLNQGLVSDQRSKKKRPLERGLGPGLDPASLNNKCNDFKCLVEGDPGIEPGTFGSGALFDQICDAARRLNVRLEIVIFVKQKGLRNQ
jgi:hypothetical protein